MRRGGWRSDKEAWFWAAIAERRSTLRSGRLQGREEVTDLILGGRQRIRAVNRVVIDRFREIGANGSRRGFPGVGCAHQLAIEGDGILAFEDLDNHRARAHELDQSAEKGPFAVNRIKAFRLIAGQRRHPRGDDPESRALETSIDRSDDIFCNRVRLDDGKGTFYRHSRAPNKINAMG